MAKSTFNYVGVLIGVVAGIASAFILAAIAGVFIGLVGSAFIADDGNTSIFFDGLFQVLFVAPPFVICGFVAAQFGREQKLLHSLVAGGLFLAVLLALTLIPNDNPKPWVFSDYLYIIQILPLAIFGGWLNAKFVE